MKKFHSIEFELPKDYLLVDNNNFNNFKNTTNGYLTSWLNEQQIHFVLHGSQVIIFKNEKIQIDSTGHSIPMESIFLFIGSNEYPNISEEEYLNERKFQTELRAQLTNSTFFHNQINILL